MSGGSYTPSWSVNIPHTYVLSPAWDLMREVCLENYEKVVDVLIRL